MQSGVALAVEGVLYGTKGNLLVALDIWLKKDLNGPVVIESMEEVKAVNVGKDLVEDAWLASKACGRL